jgi:hypothetical protein
MDHMHLPAALLFSMRLMSLCSIGLRVSSTSGCTGRAGASYFDVCITSGVADMLYSFHFTSVQYSPCLSYCREGAVVVAYGQQSCGKSSTLGIEGTAADQDGILSRYGQHRTTYSCCELATSTPLRAYEGQQAECTNNNHFQCCHITPPHVCRAVKQVFDHPRHNGNSGRCSITLRALQAAHGRVADLLAPQDSEEAGPAGAEVLVSNEGHMHRMLEVG